MKNVFDGKEFELERIVHLIKAGTIEEGILGSVSV